MFSFKPLFNNISKERFETRQDNYSEFRFKPLVNKPVNKHVNKPVNKPVDFSIKKLYIFTRAYTEFCAKNFKTYFESLNIECKLFMRNITNTDIAVCNNDPNLYFFIIGPQYIVNYSRQECLQKTGKNLNSLPNNKYILYQIEQLNQIDQKRNNLENIKDILDKSYAIFDYSTINLQYYPENVRENVKLLAPLIEGETISTPQGDISSTQLILFIGTMNNRRENILNKLKDKGYNLKIVSQVFGHELVDEIKKCDIVLNLHYYDNAILEI